MAAAVRNRNVVTCETHTSQHWEWLKALASSLQMVLRQERFTLEAGDRKTRIVCVVFNRVHI